MFIPLSLPGKLFRKYLLAPKHPSKVRVQNAIGKLLLSRNITLKNADDVKFELDPNDWITRILLMEGNYESGSTSLAKKLLTEGGTFLDVGANFGLFTCIAAAKNEKVKVIAVEPNYKIVPRLVNHIRINDLQDRVKIINAAVSGTFQFVSMEQPAADNMGTTLTRAGAGGALSVLSAPLDFICKENKVAQVQLLKIDIEGNEFDILKDFSFSNCYVKNIILEFNHLSIISFDQLHTFFKEKGFSSYTIDGKPLNSSRDEIPENNIWFVNDRIQ